MPHYTITDFTSPELKQKPFPILKDLRTTAPLYRFELPDGRNAWMVTRYDDVLAILKDQRFVKDIRHALSPEVAAQVTSSSEAQMNMIRRHMLASDPPDHTRLRHLVSKAFTPRMIEQIRPRIQQIADELLDQVQAQGQMDLIADFAFPLPITVICELLGVPVGDRQKFRVWSNALLDQSGLLLANTEAPAELGEFARYLQA